LFSTSVSPSFIAAVMSPENRLLLQIEVNQVRG
jgi:hypothetical protein